MNKIICGVHKEENCGQCWSNVQINNKNLSGNFTTISNEEYKRLKDIEDKFNKPKNSSALEFELCDIKQRLSKLERENQTLMINMCHH